MGGLPEPGSLKIVHVIGDVVAEHGRDVKDRLFAGFRMRDGLSPRVGRQCAQHRIGPAGQ